MNKKEQGAHDQSWTEKNLPLGLLHLMIATFKFSYQKAGHENHICFQTCIFHFTFHCVSPGVILQEQGWGIFLLFSFLIQNFELVALIKTMYKLCFTYSSSGSASCFPCHSGRAHNLSWLVILALILFCGLNQGLGPLYFFIRIYFFPFVLIAIEMLTVMWLAPSGADTRDASWITGQRA